MMIACSRFSRWVCLLGGLLGLPASGAHTNSADAWAAFRAADEARRAGQTTNAFRQFLALPGGEYAALTIARSWPGEFLDFLRAQPAARSPRARVVEADLLLGLKRKAEAEAIYRELAAPGVNWTGDQPPPVYYPVEPPQGSDNEGWSMPWFLREGAQPFLLGPGSHRDNWLLRRLLAFDFHDAADREFARLWEFHRAFARPYVAEVAAYDLNTRIATTNRQVFRPAGFDAGGLQFAVDYAFFHKQRRRTNDALAVLLEPFGLLDLDRNPNQAQPAEVVPAGQPPPFPERPGAAQRRGRFGQIGPVGLTRKDFIRLAFGEFKTLGREAELIATVQKEIDAGANRARRVLAQLRLHQGRTDEALALELEYIARGAFDEASAAYRRGLIYDGFRRPTEAAAALELLLVKPLAGINAPAAEEEVAEAAQWAVRSTVIDWGAGGRGAPQLVEIQARLERLYTALGRTDRSLQLALLQHEANDNPRASLTEIERLARRFTDAGQGVAFTNWAKQRLVQSASANVGANFAWWLNDRAAARTNIASLASNLFNHSYVREWKERFRTLGPEPYRELLTTLAAVGPTNGPAALARLELLDLDGRIESADAIEPLERLLDFAPKEWYMLESVFPRRRGPRTNTTFRYYLDVAYRLLRLYERHQRLDDLRALGLRLARGDRPFHEFEGNLHFSVGVNDWDTIGNACLALVVQYAEAPAYQRELGAALETSRWARAYAQWERRVGRDAKTPRADRPAVSPPLPPWANVPTNLELRVCADNVLCLAHDDTFVFAGHAWGVVVYDLKGRPVTRFALGTPVTTLAAGPLGAWAGTAAGLFRLRQTNQVWTVASQRVAGPVGTLALAGDELWIGTAHAVQVLDTRALELRTFSGRDFKVPDAWEFGHFIFDGHWVWVDSTSTGVQRYDRRTGEWTAPAVRGPRYAPHLIGFIDGELWGCAWINDALRWRPGRLERESLTFTVVPVHSPQDAKPPLINNPISYLGRHAGQLAFGGWEKPLVFDPAGNIVRPLILGEGQQARFTDAPETGLRLADGTRVFSVSPGDQPGLRFVSQAGITNLVSTFADPRALPGETVHSVWFDEAGDWLCTSGGLMRQTRDGCRRFTHADGLLSTEVHDVVKLAGKFWFACGWSAAAGGLMSYDPTTRVFTSFHRADGLDSDKLESLAVTADQKLRVTFAAERVWESPTGDMLWRLFPPGLFDPATLRFASGGPPAAVESNRPPPPSEPCPWLGGSVLKRVEHGGRTWLCGTHGLAVFPGASAPVLVFAELGARIVRSRSEELWADFQRRPVIVTDNDHLAALLRDANPYIRAEAMMRYFSGTSDRWRPLIAQNLALVLARVADPHPRVRGTALFWLRHTCPDAEWVPALKSVLNDSDPNIRDFAAIELAARGHFAGTNAFRATLEHEWFHGRLPVGAESGYSGYDGRITAAHALAAVGTPEVFALVLEFPLADDDYAGRVAAFQALGQALCRHPESAAPLLHAEDEPHQTSRVRFAQRIFREAGKHEGSRALRPGLREALRSEDRVVRANAARACGALGDIESIPALRAALQPESGLSRAAAVWALGELKAREAVPDLIAIYQEARLDSERGRGPGWRLAQATAAAQAQYAHLRDLNELAADWNELKKPSGPQPSGPRATEARLTPAAVVDAVRKIGPEGTQEFWRSLLGAKVAKDRAAAAVGLAYLPAAETNRPLLRPLLVDPVVEVRAAALVSLLALGDTARQASACDLLKSADNEARAALLEHLVRLDRAQLEFVRPELEAIARHPQTPLYLQNKVGAVRQKL